MISEIELNEKWEKATLKNNFIFYKVMRHNPDLCKSVLEILLEIKISKIVIKNEEVIDVDFNSKGIRLDVYLTDTERIFDIEIQAADTKELSERARYYQGIMDVDSLKKGEPYRKLLESHVIFICFSDVFRKNIPIYTFENVCLEDGETKLNDRTFKHFFIAPLCAKMLENKEQRAFFIFLSTNKAESKLTQELKESVLNAKQNTVWRQQFMNWERYLTYEHEAGFEQGVKKGRIKEKELIAQNMLREGFSVSVIASVTGLSAEEIYKLK